MDTRPPSLLNLLGQRWRNIGTAISFALFGIGGLTLAFVAIPLIHLASRIHFSNTRKSTARLARADIAQRCISASFRIYIRIMRNLRVIDYRIENAPLLREDEGTPTLVAANHPSLLDYVFLTAHMPLCDCIVKKTIARQNPFTKHLTHSAGYIPNHNAEQLFDACRARLDQGRRILIFPEGTRSTPGQPLKLQRGAANIAIRCRVPIRIIHITCTPPILTRQQKWWATGPTRPLFRITVRDKIDITPYLEPANDGSNDTHSSTRHSARLLTAHLQTALDPSASTANTTSNDIS